MKFLSLETGAVLSALVTLTAAASAQTFTDRTLGLGGPPVGTTNLFFGSGAAVGDFDGDGDLDIVSSQGVGAPIRIWENTGNFTFVDRTSGSGLGSGTNVRGMATADVDNDGDLDLLVTEWRAQSHLFINGGNFRFTDEGFTRGFRTTTSKFTAAFGDYNRDGWVDVYIGNRVTPIGDPEPNELYVNNGDGTFTEVGAAAGVDHVGLSFASTFVDYNEDGWPDIAVANDKGPTLSPNEVFENNGDGTFTPVGAMIGADIRIDGMGVDYADVFNNGGVDLYFSDVPSDHHFLRWDDATSSYVDDAYAYSMEGGPLGWTVKFEDFDNDAWTDLFINHVSQDHYIMMNPGAAESANAPWTTLSVSGSNLLFAPAGATLAFNALTGDLDDDGDIDLICRWQGSATGLSIYENTISNSNNYLRFTTTGTRSHRDAFNTRIELTTGSLVQRDWSKSGSGYLSQCDPRVHFGLGTATQADRVEITWPSGQKQYLFDVPANQTIDLREPQLVVGNASSNAVAPIGSSTTIEFESGTDATLTYVMLLSATSGPGTILPDGTELPVVLDSVTSGALLPGNSLLSGGTGTLSGSGTAQATMTIPASPVLVGTQLFSTAVTLDPGRFPLVRTFVNESVDILIQ